jgi:serine/threonine-protein kinase
MSGSRPKPVRVGDVVGGKYCVERTLGEGGIGIVVRARHIELRQPVAIKALLLSDDEEQVARFMREARASVQLRGEHVAKVTDVGRLDDGTPFMVMEYLDGEDLGAVADRQRLPPGDAVAYVLQACEGIAEAHALGIIHRDIKPRNLFLTRNGRGRPLVKVLDFGLAKTVGKTDKDSHVTSTLTIAGSPPYMSPEQVRALRDIDVRTDVWSLGVCLYELLSGETPFDAPTIPEVCARVLMDQPTPIDEWVSHVPEGLRSVIERCFAKERDRRFANLGELAAALEPFASADAHGAADRIREALSARPRAALPDDEPIEAEPSNPDALTLVRRDSETRTAFHTAQVRLPRRFGRPLRFKGPAWVLAVGVVSIGILVFSATGVAFRYAQGGSRDGTVTPLAAHSAAPAAIAPAILGADLGRSAAGSNAVPGNGPAAAAESAHAGADESPSPVEAPAPEAPRSAKSAAATGTSASGTNVNGAAFHSAPGAPAAEPANSTTRKPPRPRPLHPESQRM